MAIELLQLQLFFFTFIKKKFFCQVNIKKKKYLLKAKEQAAAEKQPVSQVPIVPSAGKATQLSNAPIVSNR